MRHRAGKSFQYVADIDSGYADGHFAGWSLRCQIRDRYGRLISEVDAEWADPATTRSINLYQKDTSTWPVGAAEFDILLESEEGETQASEMVQFEIYRGATL